jgi:outer membrane protein assembly factor BamB
VPPAAGRPQCDARPVSAADLAAILREGAPEDPDANDPRGEPLPPAERATIGNVVSRWIACLASGNIRGLLGLFSADGIRRLLAERAPYIGGPVGLRVSVLAVSEVERLRDGRIAARVAVDPTGNGTAAPETLLMVIEQGEDGAWYIDHLRAPQAPVGAAGNEPRDPQAPSRPLLRHPIVPGPGVAVPAPGPAMPMRGGDAARTGNQPGPAAEANLQERWRAPTGWHSTAQPVVARGLVYFGGYSLGERTPLLEAVDMMTGAIRWQTTAPVAWAEFPDSPALSGDVLFAPVQAPVAGIMAVVAATGQPLWYAPFGFTSVTAPAVDSDAVYVSGWGLRNARDQVQNDVSGVVSALDQRTGRERWRFLASTRFGPLAVGRDTVFVPSDHGLFALDRATGRKRWQARFSTGPGETPTVVGEIVVFAGIEITSGKTGVFALDAATGALRWQVTLPAVTGARAGTAVSGDTLFVSWWEPLEGQPGNGRPTLRAYELASGKERWVYRADVGDRAAGEPVVGAMTEPSIVGDMALFGFATRPRPGGTASALGGLYAIETETGNLVWQIEATPIRSASAAIDGMIFVMGGSRPQGDAAGGNLLAFAAE